MMQAIQRGRCGNVFQEVTHGDRAFERQLRGWNLTTAEIMYRMPDYRDILQTFICRTTTSLRDFPASSSSSISGRRTSTGRSLRSA